MGLTPPKVINTQSPFNSLSNLSAEMPFKSIN